MLPKRGLYIFQGFSKIFFGTVQETASESDLRGLCGRKALQTLLIMNAIFTWRCQTAALTQAFVIASQYIKSQRVPTLQINYCIVEHVKKKKIHCASMRKATYTETAAFTFKVSVTDELLYLLTSLV